MLQENWSWHSTAPASGSGALPSPGSPEEWSCLWWEFEDEAPCSAAECFPATLQSLSDALAVDLPSENKTGIWEAADLP